MNYGNPGGALGGATVHPDYSHLKQQGAQVAPPATLVSALSGADTLNGRLCKLSEQVHTLAVRIGGPWPTDISHKATAADAPVPAIQELNDRINGARDWVSAIEGAVAAMQRTLGSN